MQDTITILELSKKLRRLFKTNNCELLQRASRYLIEPRSSSMIKLNEFMEANALKTFSSLFTLIGDYNIIQDEVAIETTICSVL